MAIAIVIPAEQEQRLRPDAPNLDAEAKEAVALDLFRNEKITHSELGRMLGLDRFETDTFLTDRKEYALSLTPKDLESDRQTLKQVLRDKARNE